MPTSDVLLIGSHPDDVEWGAGGIALILAQKKKSFAIVDLTQGEMGSRGTIEDRQAESAAAAEFLGASTREMLGMPDGGIVDSPEARKRIAGVIRRHRPAIVLAPYWEDRHPDHAATGLAVRNSALYCSMNKLDDPNPPHKPEAFLYYLLHNYRQPSFVVDISNVYEAKRQLMNLHQSQFAKTAEEYGVLPLGVGDYLFGLESRDRFFGSLIGVRQGEALVLDRPVKLTSVSEIIEV